MLSSRVVPDGICERMLSLGSRTLSEDDPKRLRGIFVFLFLLWVAGPVQFLSNCVDLLATCLDLVFVSNVDTLEDRPCLESPFFGAFFLIDAAAPA